MKYWPVVLVFAAIGVWMVMAAKQPTGEEGLYKIISLDQYNATLAKVRDLTQKPIIEFDEGKYLTKSQIDNLKKGTGMIKEMIAFEPTNFGPYVMLAKSQRAMGDMEEAVRNYKQALLLIPKDITDQETLWTAAEVNYDLGTYYYENDNYAKAEDYAISAVMLINNNPKYLIGLAAIQAKLGKLAEARTLIDAVLKTDPTNTFAKDLDKELKKAGH